MGIISTVWALVGFSLVCAVITPALITGATADRLKFGSYALLIAVWSLVVYVPVAKWVWNGWILDMGALDFAGGTAIHINAGVAALAVVIVIGIKDRMNWDDSLDVIAVHLVGGLVGTLLLGLFADATVNGDFNGLFYGGGLELLKDQFVAAVIVGTFSFVMTYLIASGIQWTIGLRVDEEAELLGLDQSQHAESAYTS